VIALKKTAEKEEFLELAASLRDLLLKDGADDAVVEVARVSSRQLKFANNKIVKTGSEAATAISAFVAKEGRTASTSLRDVSGDRAAAAVKELLKFASSVEPNKNYGGIAEGPFSYAPIEAFHDKKIPSLQEKSVDLVEGAINAALAAGAKRCAGVFEWDEEKRFLATSGGVEAQEQGTTAYFSFRAIAGEGSGHKVGASRTLSKIDFEGVAERAARVAVDSRKAVEGKPGNYDVVFDSLAFACLLNEVGAAASAFSAESGFSFLTGKTGEKVASENVNFYDDGRLSNGYDSALFDAEGVPTRRTTLIEEGVFKTFLHNTSTAKRFKAKTTGNAGIVVPRAWNLVLREGEWSEEEMVSEARHGLYITNVWYTRFQNYSSGDFSTIPRDGLFLIENGEITGAVKHLRVSESMQNLLESVVAVGKKAEQIKSWEASTPTVTPAVLARSLKITKPTS
jgi:PmbA protein